LEEFEKSLKTKKHDLHNVFKNTVITPRFLHRMVLIVVIHHTSSSIDLFFAVASQPMLSRFNYSIFFRTVLGTDDRQQHTAYVVTEANLAFLFTRFIKPHVVHWQTLEHFRIQIHGLELFWLQSAVADYRG